MKRAFALLIFFISATASAATLPYIAPGTWYEIPDSKLRSVVPVPPVDGAGDVSHITAWSGGAFDPASNRLFIWGGGHSDYAGNEVYAFDLDTLTWERLTDPSRPDSLHQDTYLADGLPRSRHTYDYLEVVNGKLLSFGGASLYPYGGDTTRRVSEFDPEAKTWMTGGRMPVPNGGSMIGAHARLDPVSGDVFVLPGGRSALRRYSPQTNEWSARWGSQYVRLHSSVALDPERRKLLLLGSGTDMPQFVAWPLDVPGAAQDLRPLSSGDEGIEQAQAPGFDFHPPTKLFYAWAGGADVYVLNPDNWQWSKYTGAGISPGPARSTGTYGRFRYVPALDLFVLMNGIDANVFVYRSEKSVDPIRFGFAEVPELAFVRGLTETVQLGIYQIDHENRWAAGDLTRASGWTSRQPTVLVDAITGGAVPGFSYDSLTAELRYDGTWSGDVTAELRAVKRDIKSQPFRLRVLTPTVVYGDGAAALNLAQGWGAKVCGPSFAECRMSGWRGGYTDEAPLVVHITTGRYTGQDWYVPARPYVYVLGHPVERPTLVGDALGGANARIHSFAGLDLEATRLAMANPNADGTNDVFIRNVRQCCGAGETNGFSNPHGTTKYPWRVFIHNFEGRMMGGPGNTTHQFYVEGRPHSIFDLNNVRIIGTRGSSAIKTTMQQLRVRHSLLVHHPQEGTPQDLQMHTPIDVPGFSESVIYGNELRMFRKQGQPLPAMIFIRNRQNSFGSDIPNYPNRSWNPPVSSYDWQLSPGKGWSGGPETYVNPAFWDDVASQPLDSHENELLFKHYVSFNKFVVLPDSAGIKLLRDDGTWASKPEYQFGPTVVLRTSPNWIERSTTFWHGNEYVGTGFWYDMQSHQYVSVVEPGAIWPRTLPGHFPRVVPVEGKLPEWFKL